MTDRILALGLILSLAPLTAHAQGSSKALPCFFNADFEDGTIPAGWDLGADVERLTPDGAGTGEFVPAWTVGTAEQANVNGVFPVPDLPIGGHFAMANDDAPPCNCDMSDVALTTAAIDLTDRTNVWLEVRLFNSPVASGDTAYVLATTNGTDWDTVLTAPPAAQWAMMNADLSAYDGDPELRIRFTWSDGGRWASGLAVDDICLRERLANDLTVVSVHTNDISGDPFQLGDRTLRYRNLPLEQAAPLHPSLRITNNGTNTASGITVTVTIDHNGEQVFQQSGFEVSDLAPGATTNYTAVTGWVPDQPGTTVVTMEVGSDQGDEDPADNMGSASMRITGPGWENGYGEMAADEGQPQTAVGGTDAFIAATRMEVLNPGSIIKGISALITSSSSVGAEIRAMLMDANLAFIDTSARHVLTQQDLDNAGAGIPIYLALSAPTEVAPGDYFVGMQHLDDDGAVGIWTSGNRPVGSDVVMEGSNFVVSYVASTPMVRMHLEDLGVGITETDNTAPRILTFLPNPMSGMGWITADVLAMGHGRLQVFDMMGKLALEQDLGALSAGPATVRISVADLVPGMYTALLWTGGSRSYGRFEVQR